MRDTSRIIAPVSIAIIAVAILAPAAPAGAQAVIEVTIRNHRFLPSVIAVPPAKSVILHITNADPLAEEFDSPALKIEKVIAGGQDGNVRLRPLDKGSYPFTGEYHADTAKGVVIAR